MPIASNYGSQFSFRRDCRVKSGSLVVPRELRSGRSTMKSYNKFFIRRGPAVMHTSIYSSGQVGNERVGWSGARVVAPSEPNQPASRFNNAWVVWWVRQAEGADYGATSPRHKLTAHWKSEAD